MVVIEEEGDLLNIELDYIVHLCNCKSATASGLTTHIFKKYPQANTYSRRDYKRIAGEISIHECEDGKRIVNMYSQHFPGNPRQNGFDSETKRKSWFASCIVKLVQFLNSNEKSDTYRIGFPKTIAEQSSDEYSYIEEMSKLIKGNTVIVNSNS